jgi:putative ABC transport system permease protein
MPFIIFIIEPQIKQNIMIKNYLKIAWRSLVRNKANSFINIAGLSVGMAVSLLIGLWIWDELSYNKNFANYSHIVRVKENSTYGNVNTLDAVPIPLAVNLKTKYPSDFSKISLGSANQAHILAFGDKKLGKEGMFVQPDFTSIFSLEMLKGTLNSLDDPSSIILNQSLAQVIFGNEDPVNQLIKIDNKKSLKVSGVYKDFPDNSEFSDVNFFIPWDFFVADQPWVKRSETAWNNNSFQVFALLQNNADLKKIQAKVAGELKGHERVDKPEVLLHPMSRWHLYNEFKDGKNTGGNIQFVWMFGITGFFVLLLACINFMNLSTARSEKRAREVGIRKAIGSLRKQLIMQFLSESVLIAFLSFLLAMGMVFIALPWFNLLAGKHMTVLWDNAWFWLSAIGFTFFTGMIAGSYPAFYLSSFNAVKVLKGTFKAGPYAAIPRKVLVVLQFTVSIALIIATIVIYREIRFAKDRPVGYSRDGLLTINMNTPDLYGRYDAIRNDLISSGGAVEMAESSSRATEVSNSQSYFNWRGRDPSLNPSFGVIGVSLDFGKTIGWQFKEGRDFSKEFKTDAQGLIMNEAAAKLIGIANPVGETIAHEVDGKITNYKVIGVIHDMVMESPFDPIRPIIYFSGYDDANVIMVKVNPALSMSSALPKIEAVFKKYNPGSPFDFKFVDDDYATKFASEERVSSIATVFAVFTIFISCLGLFGLASFTAAQRTKEIGVRKILGASVFSVWRLLSTEFVVMILLSLLIAMPVAYYFMHGWLQNYQYRTEISWWIFAATASGAILITLATVSFQSIKAALANPVKSMRSE